MRNHANIISVSLFLGRFEKYFSGKYMGDIVRRILVQLATEHGFFGGKTSPKLLEFAKMTTTHVSTIEE